jgi:hypothetical protein
MIMDETITRKLISQKVVNEHNYMMWKEIIIGFIMGVSLFIILFSKEIMYGLKPYFLYVKLIVQIVRREPSQSSPNDARRETQVMDHSFDTRLNIANMVRNIMLVYVLIFLFAINFFDDSLHAHLFGVMMNAKPNR